MLEHYMCAIQELDDVLIKKKWTKERALEQCTSFIESTESLEKEFSLWK